MSTIKKKEGNEMSDEGEQELFTCNACGFVRTKAGFSYDNPISDINGGGNYCSGCEDRAIKCPECGLLGWYSLYDNRYHSIDYIDVFTVSGSGYGRIGLKCRCGCEFGILDEDHDRSTV